MKSVLELPAFSVVVIGAIPELCQIFPYKLAFLASEVEFRAHTRRISSYELVPVEMGVP